MVVLMTDFGEKDPYVGIMKGVMLGLHPTLPVVDLTHGIAAQDVSEAAFVLKTSVNYFPRGTLFVAVVDPGVGSARRIIYAETEHYRFLAPDNGILGLVFEEQTPIRVIEVREPKYFLQPLSRTFHGRDIFAPVAARLALGMNPEELGDTLESGEIHPSPFPKAHLNGAGAWHGSVIYVDRFGNLITNFWRSLLRLNGDECVEVRLKGKIIKGLVKAYSNHHEEAVALLNSFDTVEIAVGGGSAAGAFDVKKGEEVMLEWQTSSS